MKKEYNTQRRIIKLIAIILGLFAISSLCMLPSQLQLINAWIEDRIISEVTIWDIFISPIIGFFLNILTLGFARGLFLLYESSRKGMAWLLFISILLSIPSTIMMSTRTDNILPFIITILIIIIVYILLICILCLPGIKKAIPAPPNTYLENHNQRLARFARIKNGWKSLGVYDNIILLPVALLSFIFAPFTYFAAGIYYLVFVLPLKPNK